MKLLYYLFFVVIGYLLYAHSPMLFLYIVGAVVLYKVLIGNKSHREYLYYFYTPEYLRGILLQMQKHSTLLEKLIDRVDQLAIPVVSSPENPHVIPSSAETLDEFEHVTMGS